MFYKILAARSIHRSSPNSSKPVSHSLTPFNKGYKPAEVNCCNIPIPRPSEIVLHAASQVVKTVENLDKHLQKAKTAYEKMAVNIENQSAAQNKHIEFIY
jgi:hypothetical protein